MISLTYQLEENIEKSDSNLHCSFLFLNICIMWHKKNKLIEKLKYCMHSILYDNNPSSNTIYKMLTYSSLVCDMIDLSVSCWICCCRFCWPLPFDFAPLLPLSLSPGRLDMDTVLVMLAVSRKAVPLMEELRPVPILGPRSLARRALGWVDWLDSCALAWDALLGIGCLPADEHRETRISF